MEKQNGKIIFPLVAMLGIISTISGCGETFKWGEVTSTQLEVFVPTQTLIPPNTLKSTSTLLSSPTPTLILIPMPTWTPAPTLQPDEAHDLVLELLETNADCELPCWWGIDPRSYEWREALTFLEKFSPITKEKGIIGGKGGYFDIFLSSTGLQVVLEIYFSNSHIDQIHIINNFYTKENDGYKLEYNNPTYFQLVRNYTLANILTKYGQPSQVLFRSFAPNFIWYESRTLLFYPENGFYVLYISKNDLKTINDKQFIETCPSEGLIWLGLFDANDSLSLQDLLKPYEKLSKYKELEEVTEMTIEKFYEVFQVPDCNTKIITPVELWPVE